MIIFIANQFINSFIIKVRQHKINTPLTSHSQVDNNLLTKGT